MKTKPFLVRLAALALSLVLLAAPAQALTVEQARELLAENYVDPIPQEVLDQPTIDEILDALGDPYTEYLTPQEYEAFLATMADDSTGGIGVTASAVEQGLLISAVTPGGPAQAAGLQEGDILVAVDGTDIVGMSADQATALIRGEEGTRVQVTYLRDGRRKSVSLTRSVITIPSTTSSLLEGGVGYIDCNTWGEQTPAYFREAIETLDGQVDSWLIDLRGNTGGSTSAATDAASLFCGPGPMLYLRSPSSTADGGYSYRLYEGREAALTQKPVVILVNGYTASASEAFAAILRDYARGVVVGSNTYGKGVAQGLWDRDLAPQLFPEGDCLKITIARFYSPLSNTTDVLGVIPHIVVDDESAAETGVALAQGLGQAGEDWQVQLLAILDDLAMEYRFSDAEDHPFEPSIVCLAVYGIVNGKGDGLFHPEDSLTRSELAQILQNLLRYDRGGTGTAFADVAPDAWYAEAVQAMSAMGLMTGTGPDTFSPDQVLSHQELFTVLGRLGRWLNDDLDLTVRREPEAGDELWVLEDYAPWAKSSVWLLSCALESSGSGLDNLLWDEPENIDPTLPATRGETADAIYSLLYYLSILP